MEILEIEILEQKLIQCGANQLESIDRVWNFNRSDPFQSLQCKQPLFSDLDRNICFCVLR